MKSFAAILLLFFIYYSNSYAFDSSLRDTIPPDFPDISTYISPDAAPGYIYYTTAVNPYQLVILDQSGVPVYFNDELQGTYSNFRYQHDNLYTFADQLNATFVGMDSQYNYIDTFRMGSGLQADFHDIQFTPEGNVILMAYDTREVDMSQLVPGGHPNAAVEGLLIQELDPFNNVVFEWQSWDHFEITDGLTVGFNPVDFTKPSFSYVHCNSIEIDHDGHLIISSRHMSEVTKINRQSGEIIWRMGGLNNEFTFVNDSLQGFTDQHDARRLDNGHILIFDNGLNHETPTTRVVEYALDEVDKVATLVWSYENPEGHLTQISGNAQRLDNGNTFIYWGRRAGVVPAPTNLAVEVDQGGNTVFELFFNDPAQVGFIYRIFKLPWNAPEIITGAPHFSAVEARVKLLSNPSHEVARFEISASESDKYHLMISDVSGRIREKQVFHIAAGHTKMVTMDTGKLPAGPYFYILSSAGKLTSGKFFVNH